jgi:hypothetical protein
MWVSLSLTAADTYTDNLVLYRVAMHLFTQCVNPARVTEQPKLIQSSWVNDLFLRIQFVVAFG